MKKLLITFIIWLTVSFFGSCPIILFIKDDGWQNLLFLVVSGIAILASSWYYSSNQERI